LQLATRDSLHSAIISHPGRSVATRSASLSAIFAEFHLEQCPENLAGLLGEPLSAQVAGIVIGDQGSCRGFWQGRQLFRQTEARLILGNDDRHAEELERPERGFAGSRVHVVDATIGKKITVGSSRSPRMVTSPARCKVPKNQF